MKQSLLILFALINVQLIAQTTHVVTSVADGGPGSLRTLITGATAGDIIRFDPNLIVDGSDTIKLTTGEIFFTEGLTIIGLYNMTDTLVISGENESSIFSADLESSATKDLTLDSLVLIKGNSVSPGFGFLGEGGAIFFSRGHSLNINNSIIKDSRADFRGGAIFSNSSASVISINNSTISGNNANNGGGIYIAPTTNSSSTTSNLMIVNSTINDNEAGSRGGGVYAQSANSMVNIINSTIANNISGSFSPGIYCLGASNLTSTSSVEVLNSTFTSNFGGPSVVSLAQSSSSFGVETAILEIASSIIAPVGAASSVFNGIVIDDITEEVSTFPIVSIGYNVFGDAPTGHVTSGANADQINVTEAELNLGTLQNNGGTTQTILPGEESVAIDAGNPDDLSEAQNGAIVDRRDIGAAETGIETEEEEEEGDESASITNEDQETFKLYPNPVNESFRIQGIPANLNIAIYDFSGRKLIETKSTQKNFIIDVSHLQPSVYLVKIDGYRIEHLIVQ